MKFSRLMFINLFCTCILVRIRFRYQRCDICVDLGIVYMLRIAVLKVSSKSTKIEFNVSVH